MPFTGNLAAARESGGSVAEPVLRQAEVPVAAAHAA